MRRSLRRTLKALTGVWHRCSQGTQRLWLQRRGSACDRCVLLHQGLLYGCMPPIHAVCLVAAIHLTIMSVYPDRPAWVWQQAVQESLIKLELGIMST